MTLAPAAAERSTSSATASEAGKVSAFQTGVVCLGASNSGSCLSCLLILTLRNFLILFRMKLKKLSYRDFNWELKDLQLGQANLIVGKNATGKSRTLQVIDLLLKTIRGERKLNWAAEWKLEFENYKKQIVRYNFKTKIPQGIVEEEITIDNENYLTRSGDGSATMRSESDGHLAGFYPPNDRLVLQVRRDTKDFPFLENIADWEKNSHSFKFGNIAPKQWANVQDFGQLMSSEDVPTFFQDLSAKDVNTVISEMNNIGFKIISINREQRTDTSVLIIREENLDKPIPHYNLSQGMFRAISLIIFLQYLISQKKPAMVLIDDLCEGMDYDRGRKLGKLIFDKCTSNDIQLISTSNDNFLMDVVDIECLNVLRRNGKTVTSINYFNHPDLFNEFALTGFSNFDFFSSNYLAKHNL